MGHEGKERPQEKRRRTQGRLDPEQHSLVDLPQETREEPDKTSVYLSLLFFFLFYIYLEILPSFSHFLYIVSIILE